MRVLFLFLLLTVACPAQNLRVSRAFERPGVGTEAMRFIYGGFTLIYHVEATALLTEKHVASARVVTDRRGVLELKLTEAGAAKLKEATKGAAGDLRLAILVDEELECAPLVHGTLGNTIRISGLDQLEKKELAELAEGLAQGK